MNSSKAQKKDIGKGRKRRIHIKIQSFSGIWLHRLPASLDRSDDRDAVHHSSLLCPRRLPHVCAQVSNEATETTCNLIWKTNQLHSYFPPFIIDIQPFFSAGALSSRLMPLLLTLARQKISSKLTVKDSL